MASGREIKTKIKSTQNMRKVTRALEMVSAAKIRRAQDMMKASRPYARSMRKVIAHVAQASTDFSHPFLTQRENVARVGYIVVSTDRGLCGGLNSNLFRRLLPAIAEWQQQGVQVDLPKANAGSMNEVPDQLVLVVNRTRQVLIPVSTGPCQGSYGRSAARTMSAGSARRVRAAIGQAAPLGGRRKEDHAHQ